MPGFMPGIHRRFAFALAPVDPRNKSGDDQR